MQPDPEAPQGQDDYGAQQIDNAQQHEQAMELRYHTCTTAATCTRGML